ncbi:MAG: N-acetylmuramoyl-L-alanine amidase [Parasporobacterium sp.]|nr:N-acetylmuramoyl-L-alanine amidase [Parasporobacterium sp.]
MVEKVQHFQHYGTGFRILICVFIIAFICQVMVQNAEAAVNDTSEEVFLNPEWLYAEFSEINTGNAVLYRAEENRKDVVIGLNAGHGTEGGALVYTYCHPDKSPKCTGGTTEEGAIQSYAVSDGMIFHNGETEADANLLVAGKLKEKLLDAGFDVLMIRDDANVQLDNVARTVICNNVADCHIAIHFDSDGLDYDKGCFFISVPDGLKSMRPVSFNWKPCDSLGRLLVDGLVDQGFFLYEDGYVPIDLTQTSYSTIPSVDIELGNQSTVLNDEVIDRYAEGLLEGIQVFFSEKYSEGKSGKSL